MNPHEYRVLFEQEQSFWWYRGMRAIISGIIERDIRPAGTGLCLDVGCGTGANLEFFSHWYKCFGLEPANEAIAFVSLRGQKRVSRATVERIPHADNVFDLVTAFEVIQNVDDDVSALREIRRVTKPGGHVLVREVAFPLLSGEHDTAVGLLRRYKRGELEDKMHAAGFKVVWHSYANFFLFWPILLIRLLRRLTGYQPIPEQARSDFRFSPRLMNRAFESMLELEALWLAYSGLPWGVSIIAIGRKDD